MEKVRSAKANPEGVGTNEVKKSPFGFSGGSFDDSIGTDFGSRSDTIVICCSCSGSATLQKSDITKIEK